MSDSKKTNMQTSARHQLTLLDTIEHYWGDELCCQDDLVLFDEYLPGGGSNLISAESDKTDNATTINVEHQAGESSHPDGDERYRFYKDRYEADGVLQKIVGNRGRDNREDGAGTLYGTRNFRVVLHGILYRGGANNMFDEDEPRGNRNPLPEAGLKNLCKEGFGTVIYLYPTRFDTVPTGPEISRVEGDAGKPAYIVSCQSIFEEEHNLTYRNIYTTRSEYIREILKIIHEEITGDGDGPVYAHCWNGWHASGLISAISLMQFCGLSSDEALEYWKAATNGRHEGNKEKKAMIRRFRPIEEFKLNQEQQEAICPLVRGRRIRSTY